MVDFDFEARCLQIRRRAGSSPSTEVTLASTEQELTHGHGRRRLRPTTEVEQDHGRKAGHGRRARPRKKIANGSVNQNSQTKPQSIALKKADAEGRFLRSPPNQETFYKPFQITGTEVGIEPGIEVENEAVTGFRIKADH